MTYHELVKKVQTALAKADASKVEEHIAVQVNVTGEAEGAFYMEISGGVLYVAPYDYNDRDALLTGDGADVLAVAQGKVSLASAIADGKLAQEGDHEKALLLGSTIPAKKTPGRKPAVKDEENAPADAPKKRGRKPGVKKEEKAVAADAPKKRGRKPKNAAAEVAAPVVEEAAPVVAEVVAPAPVVEDAAPVVENAVQVVEEAAPAAEAPKKRGRKPGTKNAEKAVPAEAPKKRGRKPGAKKADAASAEAPKKRGRKPTKK